MLQNEFDYLHNLVSFYLFIVQPFGYFEMAERLGGSQSDDTIAEGSGGMPPPPDTESF